MTDVVSRQDTPLDRVITRLAPATQQAIEKMDRLTEVIRQLPQYPFVTEHMLHAGMYTRTIRLPPNTYCAAVLFAVPTVLIVVGQCRIWSNDDIIHCEGYSVLPGSANRKVAVATHSEIAASMLFPTDAKTIEEAEKQFTPEYELLVPLSMTDRHIITITGE